MTSHLGSVQQGRGTARDGEGQPWQRGANGWQRVWQTYLQEEPLWALEAGFHANNS